MSMVQQDVGTSLLHKKPRRARGCGKARILAATMKKLSDFPITKKWPAQHPDRLQLYSLTTPNGVKASIFLEETGLPYEPHYVSFETNDQTSPEFLSLNPNNKIPAMIDPGGPGGKPLALWESGAMLIYLADKTGPLFGQVGCFVMVAGMDFEDKRPRDRYVNDSKRLLSVLDGRLDGRDWIMG